MSFDTLGLAEPLLRALTALSHTTPTPIQSAAIPPLLAGRDLIGIAQTGTGKTGAFALPMIQRLAASPAPRPRRPQALVLSPTRELAIQIHASFEAYGRFARTPCAVVFGGVSESAQIAALGRPVRVLVATPGRLLALANEGHVNFDDLRVFVLDEADRMLDDGFLPDVKRIIAKLPRQRQTLFFSATMPPPIQALSEEILRDDAEKVEVSPQSTPADRIVQRVLFVDEPGKRQALTEVVRDPRVQRALVFTRTKHGANKVVERLIAAGVRASALHGNKSQAARQRALDGFRSGETPVLVATDIAARGIDAPGVSHVINYDVPNIAESYVHRIGRTARAGATGMAISFCSQAEIPWLRDIERLMRVRIQVAGDRIGLSDEQKDPDAKPPQAPRKPQQGRGGGGGRRRSPRRR